MGSNPTPSAILEHKCERRSPPFPRHLKTSAASEALCASPYADFVLSDLARCANARKWSRRKGLVGAGLGCAILPKSGVGSNPGQSGLSNRPLSPVLKRELAVVVRNDKPRHKGLREMEAALNDLKVSS